MIRLTGGRARGRVLLEPVPVGVRPTSSRVREALFSMVGQHLEGQTFLDAFGGAGIVGLEAWSRGAEVLVVELKPRIARSIRARGQELDATWTVRVGDSYRLAQDLPVHDIVFADPPYNHDPVRPLEALALVAGEWLVLEARVGPELPLEIGGLQLERVKEYGQRGLWLYRRSERGLFPVSLKRT